MGFLKLMLYAVKSYFLVFLSCGWNLGFLSVDELSGRGSRVLSHTMREVCTLQY